jgi:pimeloyl-ACP methyl ester carboxylesterase
MTVASGMLRSMLSLLLAAAVPYVAFCVFMYATQRSQMYFPTPESRHPQAAVEYVASGGERIKVWHVARPGTQALVYFGGNAEDVAGNIDELARRFPAHSLYLVNYRGYGGSSGQPTEEGLCADALAVFDFAVARHAVIAAMGRSLGSGVAAYLASRRPVSRLVLVTPYDSLVNVGRAHFGYLPVGLLLRDRYEAARLAPAVAAPVLMVIAEHDEIIPRARSDALLAAFRPGQVETAVIRGAMHNTLDLSPDYVDAVEEFLLSDIGDAAGDRLAVPPKQRGSTE